MKVLMKINFMKKYQLELKRFTMKSTRGIRSVAKPDGMWCRYNDVERILKQLAKNNPRPMTNEEYLAALAKLQNESNFTELMVMQEEVKTLPFGDVWEEYCTRCGVPADKAWFDEVKKYGTFLRLANSSAYYGHNKQSCDAVFSEVCSREKMALMSVDVLRDEKHFAEVDNAISDRFKKMGLSHSLMMRSRLRFVQISQKKTTSW